MKPDDIVTINFADKIPVNIFRFRADKHDFRAGWETAYLSELANTIRQGMVVYDIGAENGEFTAMVARIVGGENVHIFEPSPSYWPNIKGLWEANHLEEPGGCWPGYVDDSKYSSYSIGGWPKEIHGWLFHNTNHVVPSEYKAPSVSIDNYTSLHPYPDLIMMDIEGAELSVLRGAEKTVEDVAPIFFISIHSDDMIKQRSGGCKSDIHTFFKRHGYESFHINTDHEEHWKFFKTQHDL